MNKILRYSLLALFAVVCNFSFADAYKVLTFPDGNSKSVNNYTTTWTVTLADFTWSISNFNNNQNGWSYIKCGRKTNESVAYIDTDTQMDKAIGSVVVVIDNILSVDLVNSISLTVASDKEFANVIETVNAEKIEAGDMTFKVANPAANYYYRLTFDCKAHDSKNGIIQISKVSYYEDGDAPVIVDITNTPETAYTVTKANELIAAGEGLATAVYVKGKISEIKEIDTDQYGNATYYISDDGTTTGQLMIFRGYSLNGDKFTSKDEIKVGDEVIVYGKLVDYNGVYEMNSGSSIYSIASETNGIESIKAAVTLEDAAIYNLAGKRLAAPAKGVNIINGKKVIVK